MTTLLHSSIKLGTLHLPNRIIMAPLTRMRAPESVPTDLMATYYSQRASAGLIISEATPISPQGVGYPATPGIWNQQQIEAWQKITTAAHEKKGRMVLQLWHVGRISHPDFHDGDLPVAPSAIMPNGQAITPTGMKPFVTPRALVLEEIPGIVEDYRQAAKNALAAGFDGVEIHSANGYLLDQFLRDGTNQRTDNYGGSLENRARLLLEVTTAVIEVCGAGRVGIRLSPSGTFNDMADSNPEAIFVYLLTELSHFNLAYLHIVDALEGDIRHGAKVITLDVLRKAYKGNLIVCGGYNQVRGEAVLAEGMADAVAFGQLYIANPDLVERFQHHAPLNVPDATTFYGGDERGYIDYPNFAG
ncbi:N-ethylmaleimide reductase, FMN-linked [Crenothrix polyspora]|uniref:N-ethylmaleimide reductase, FMN-linked n=1 Tax=Crenothrix polyspora TaxID=360316 RepID=A0A1R4H7G0_9GAMM|nr:alkene reductase [Crenothrix polyspora]SJM92174.1 N-ethylmaleimide reductase, FMN-linked [Crenothrix polyspora]